MTTAGIARLDVQRAIEGQPANARACDVDLAGAIRQALAFHLVTGPVLNELVEGRRRRVVPTPLPSPGGQSIGVVLTDAGRVHDLADVPPRHLWSWSGTPHPAFPLGLAPSWDKRHLLKHCERFSLPRQQTQIRLPSALRELNENLPSLAGQLAYSWYPDEQGGHGGPAWCVLAPLALERHRPLDVAVLRPPTQLGLAQVVTVLAPFDALANILIVGGVPPAWLLEAASVRRCVAA